MTDKLFKDLFISYGRRESLVFYGTLKIKVTTAIIGGVIHYPIWRTEIVRQKNSMIG